MTEIHLYGSSVSPNVRAARIALYERSVPVTLHEIGFDGLATESYGRINPFRKMPALVHGDLCLYETAALMFYAQGFGTGPSLVPADPVEQAKMWQFIGIAQHQLYPTGVLSLYFHCVLAGLFGATPDPAQADASLAPMALQLDVLEAHLASGHLAGGALSLADLFCGAMVDYVARTRGGRGLIATRPHVEAWLGMLRARPSFAATLAPMLAGTDQP